MNIRRLPLAAGLLIGVLAVGATFAACSSDEALGNPTTSQPAATTAAGSSAAAASRTVAAAPTPTPDVGPYPGADPKLGGNVTAISPTNGQSVSQLDTQSPNASLPRGICFQADFTGLPENALWFRMALDGNEVTEQLTWLVASKDNPTGGRACYAPAKGIGVGRHSAAVSVSNPSNPNEPAKQLVAWKFEVTP